MSVNFAPLSPNIVLLLPDFIPFLSDFAPMSLDKTPFLHEITLFLTDFSLFCHFWFLTWHVSDGEYLTLHERKTMYNGGKGSSQGTVRLEEWRVFGGERDKGVMIILNYEC